MKKILDAARRNSDYEIESKVLHEQFYDKALYHNGCICKYFMKTPKETVNYRALLLLSFVVQNT
jgi:hypothetical protein